LPEAVPTGELFADLEQRAVQRSLELGAARKRFEAAARHANMATWEGWIPDVRLGVNAERGDADWGIGPMAEVELPIFYQGQAESSGAESQMRRERQLLVDAAVRVRANARSLAASLETAAKSVLQYRDVVLPLRAQVVEQAQLQYNAMNVGVFELLQAKRDELAAQQQYVSALHGYWVMRSQVEQLLAGSTPTESSPVQAAVAVGAGDTATPAH
jgi:outer membrane protein TolC